ncbi:MAG: plastocyanin/azurin family copper-binding protein [Gemmatimonadales bacterium]
MTRGAVLGLAVAGVMSVRLSLPIPHSLLPIPYSLLPAPDTTVTIRTTSSTLQFEPPAVSVQHGTRVRLRLLNEGTLPHNLVIVREEADIDSLAAAASRQGGDYVPANLKSKLIAWTPLASPGQMVETMFDAPPPGTYPYVCLVSGHAMSMLGELRVLR